MAIDEEINRFKKYLHYGCIKTQNAMLVMSGGCYTIRHYPLGSQHTCISMVSFCVWCVWVWIVSVIKAAAFTCAARRPPQLQRHRDDLLSGKHDRRWQSMLQLMNSLLSTCCQTANVHLQLHSHNSIHFSSLRHRISVSLYLNISGSMFVLLLFTLCSSDLAHISDRRLFSDPVLKET